MCVESICVLSHLCPKPSVSRGHVFERLSLRLRCMYSRDYLCVSSLSTHYLCLCVSVSMYVCLYVCTLYTRPNTPTCRVYTTHHTTHLHVVYTPHNTPTCRVYTTHRIRHLQTFCEEFEKALEEMREFQKKGPSDTDGEAEGLGSLFAAFSSKDVKQDK